EELEPAGVEHARHAAHHLLLEAGDLVQREHHRVERVGDVDHEGIRAVGFDVARHVLHDLQIYLEQVLAAHARLAGDSGGDDQDVASGDVPPIGGAGDPAVIP